MRPETLVSYEDETWECIYVNGNSKIEGETRRRILWNMIDMYKKGNTKRRIRAQTVEGIIELRGRKAHGSYSGTYFAMDGQFEAGRIDLGVLLLDRFNPELN